MKTKGSPNNLLNTKIVLQCSQPAKGWGSGGLASCVLEGEGA